MDGAVARWVRRRWGGPLDPLAKAAANIGRGGVLWIAVDLAVELSRGRRRPSGRVVAAVGSSYCATLLLARLLGRSRPCDGAGGSLIECPDGPGFPSDQTAGAFAAAVAIGVKCPPLLVPLTGLAFAVAAARVYCGVHYVSDVAAAAAIGAAVGAAATVGDRLTG